jgi:hypothetical protein
LRPRYPCIPAVRSSGFGDMKSIGIHKPLHI